MNDDVFTNWRKSSFSFSNGNCAEVASVPGAVAVRDSKDPAGPALLFGAVSWRKFTTAVRAGTIAP